MTPTTVALCCLDGVLENLPFAPQQPTPLRLSPKNPRVDGSDNTASVQVCETGAASEQIKTEGAAREPIESAGGTAQHSTACVHTAQQSTQGGDEEMVEQCDGQQQSKHSQSEQQSMHPQLQQQQLQPQPHLGQQSTHSQSEQSQLEQQQRVPSVCMDEEQRGTGSSDVLTGSRVSIEDLVPSGANVILAADVAPGIVVLALSHCKELQVCFCVYVLRVCLFHVFVCVCV